MKIGIDMLAAQSPWTRSRGIGRFAVNLVSALTGRGAGHEYVLYAHAGLATSLIPAAPRSRVVTLGPDPKPGGPRLRDAVDRTVRANPDGLDAYLVLSPLDLHGDYGPPERPAGGPKVAAVVYDAIPFVFQETYLRDPRHAQPLYRHLERLKRYDALLAISEATRADFLRLLGLPSGRVVNVSCATDGEHFRPLGVRPAADLRALGVTGPFVFNLGGMDEGNDRKNLFGLVEAFGKLPEVVRSAHQLVIACALKPEFARRLCERAEGAGVADRLVLVGEVPDATLGDLYRGCAAFAFPSLYEGFGLPLLEALRCGAAVVAGNNSSQPEVVGDAGLLANANDPADVAEKLNRVLSDPALARDLGRRGIAQAQHFSWERTAARVLDALTAGPGPGQRRAMPARRAPRPRVAVFSPFPPKASGIADYVTALMSELRSDYAFDLFHEPGYVPEPALASPDLACHDYRLFERLAAQVGYHTVLYQMGNSFYHRSIYATLLKHPGVVTLHDFSLAGFQYWYTNLDGMPPGAFRRELENFDPARAPWALSQLTRWGAEPGGVAAACDREGLYLNRRIFERSEAVIVHSDWCRDRVADCFPEHLGKTAVIPLGVRPEVVTPERRAEARRRFALPADALIFGSFGLLSPDKMNAEALDAFAAIAGEFPDALFAFVGQDWGQGEARGRASALGLDARVRFLGRPSAADYRELTAAVDVGVSLRRPPTHGETSGALLDLLRAGVPTVVTDVGTFSGFPGTVVRKVRWDGGGPDALTSALRDLAGDTGGRARLGRAAWSYVNERYAWPRAAAQYADLFERLRAARGRGHAPSPLLRGMHPSPASRRARSR